MRRSFSWGGSGLAGHCPVGDFVPLRLRLWRRCLEPLLRERSAGGTLQVPLKCKGPRFVGKGDIGLDIPRPVLGSMRYGPAVVPGQSISKVSSHPDIEALRSSTRHQNVDIAHDTRLAPCPPHRHSLEYVQCERFLACRAVASGGHRPSSPSAPTRQPSLRGACEGWWAVTGSNRRPSRCKRDALPTELTARQRRQHCRRQRGSN